MNFVRYELRECEYPHSGIVCGGSEYIEKLNKEGKVSEKDVDDFYNLLCEFEVDRPYGIPTPDYATIENKVAITGHSDSSKWLCFFTNEGLQKVQPVINGMMDILERNGGTIDKIIYISNDSLWDDKILYQDRYQAVIYWED